MITNGVRAKRYRIKRHQMGGGSVLADCAPLRVKLDELLESMSMSAVAALTGVNRSTLRPIISGKTKRTSHDTARRILAAHVGGDAGKHWVDALRARRKVQALMAIGWTLARISAESGYSYTNIKLLAFGNVDVIRSVTDQQIDTAYRRLCMRLPSPVTRNDRSAVTRAINTAKRLGWAPPLSWDDIDDPMERPEGVLHAGPPPSRAEVLAALDEDGADITAACARLKVGREALEQWCHRHGLNVLYSRLVARANPDQPGALDRLRGAA